MRGKSWQIFLLIVFFSMLIFRSFGSSQQKVMAQWVGVTNVPNTPLPTQIAFTGVPNPTIVVDPDCPPGYGCAHGYYCCNGGNCCPVGEIPPTGDPGTPVNGVCGSAHYGCAAGVLGPYAEYGDQWQWWCNGINGSTSNAWCQEMKKGRIQGRRVSSSGPSSTLNRITVSGVGNYDLYNHWETYSTGDILPWGSSYTVSTTVPAGYTASYSVCNNCVSHPDPDSFSPGSSVNVTIPSTPPAGYYTAYVDLYWKFTPVSPPTCNISASPPSINYGASSTISWSSTNATSCSISTGGWTGTSGSQNTGSLTFSVTYTCTCSGAGGSATDSTTVTVGAPPSVPGGTCGTFNTTNATTPVTWAWGSETGLQVVDSTGQWWANLWTTSPYTVTKDNNNLGSIPGIPPGRTVYGRTTYDFINFSNWGLISPSPTCPLPANQTAVISGVLRQKSGTGCYQADASNNFNLAPVISGTTGDSCVSASCTASPGNSNAVSYSCTVTWDNAGCVAQSRQPNATQTLTLTSGATGYSPGQFSNSSCTLSGITLPVTAGVNNPNADIAFQFTGSNWIKLKDSSYNGVSITGITVPAFVTSYDAVDDDATKYFIIGNAGAVLKATVNPSSAYSSPPKNWYDSSYPAGSPSMNPSAFLNYVKSRKEYQTVSAMSSITQDGIYLWSGALTLNNTNLNQATASKFVLIVDGNVTIDQDKFNIGNCTDASGLKKIAILSKTGTITFSTSTQCAAGVFIAQTVNTGSITSQGLKIKGNLIAQTTLTNGRAWSDTSKPGLFVVFDPVQYINLLPYLSTASYDWRQIQ